MPATTRVKMAGAIAGTAGTGSLTVTALLIIRMMTVHPVPRGAWVAATALAAGTALVGCLALVLDYRLKRLSAQLAGRQAQASADLEKSRLEMYRTVLEKAAGEPDRSVDYRDLITADALHLSAERGGAPLGGQARSRLHGSSLGCRPADADRPPTLSE